MHTHQHMSMCSRMLKVKVKGCICIFKNAWMTEGHPHPHLHQSDAYQNSAQTHTKHPSTMQLIAFQSMGWLTASRKCVCGTHVDIDQMLTQGVDRREECFQHSIVYMITHAMAGRGDVRIVEMYITLCRSIGTCMFSYRPMVRKKHKGA